MEELGRGFFSRTNQAISQSPHAKQTSNTVYNGAIFYVTFLEKKLPCFPNIPLCVLTHKGDLQLKLRMRSPSPLPSLALMTVARSICFMEDFQCLWKLFKDGLNLFQIYQEHILSLFFSALYHFFSSYLSSILHTEKLKITYNLPISQELWVFTYFFYFSG